MGRYNTGTIVTNDNCIGCNKCISECVVMGANVAQNKNGKSVIAVDERKCIHCGHCLSVCSHGAREYHDDTERFFEDLSAGKKIALAIAPSFYRLYPKQVAQILGYLRELGCTRIYDVAFGADLSTWFNLRYIETHMDENGICERYISQMCPVITNYAEQYSPELLKLLVPVQSPLSCLGIYARRYLKETCAIAFIGPCIAKRDEINSPETEGVIEYNVTFRNLMQHLSGIDITPYHAESDLVSIGLGDYLPASGGLCAYFERLVGNRHDALHFERALQKLTLPEGKSLLGEGRHPALADLLNCDFGCLNGPAANSCQEDTIQQMVRNVIYRQPSERAAMSPDLTAEERYNILKQAFSDLNPEDFSRTFTNRYRQAFTVPEDTYDEIFNDMYKTTEADRKINCRYCGYGTCRDMATAIALGYAKKENCINYVRGEVEQLTLIDRVTGLYNHSAFVMHTELLLRNYPYKQFMVCVVNINDFKAINALYGFETGDRILYGFSAWLVQRFGKEGIYARMSSDQFLLCLPCKEQYLMEFSSPVMFDATKLGVEQPISMRSGICLADLAKRDVNKLVDRATLAMRTAERTGMNTVAVFNEEMQQKLLDEATIVSQMFDALKNDEFKVFLQPQFNHSTGQIVGAEALCRWKKPDGSIVSPGKFIPLFEKNGFIRELDRKMWENTFALIRKWLDEGISFVPISTNISRISLLDPNLPEVIEKLSEKYGVEPHYLNLEITESAYMSNQKQIIRSVERLQELGFLIEMDDFGSGYSSLNTLKDLPIDLLKIDMGFFRGNEHHDRGGGIISSVVHMAQSLGLLMVAEGVETVPVADYLRSLGCDVIQGYLYSKPIPVEDYEKLLQTVGKQYVMKRPHFLELIDANRFFDPDSAESKMFDNYIGGAFVFEYSKGNVEIIRINETYLNIIGADKISFEKVRRQFLQTLTKETRTIFLDTINEAIQTKQKVSCVTERLDKDGKSIFVKVHIWYVFTCGERYVMYGLVENITAEKQTEKNLAAANEQFNLIMDNSPAGICLLQLTHGKKMMDYNLKPVLVNRGFAEVSGYSVEEMMGYSYEELMNIIHPEDRKKFILALVKAIQTHHGCVIYRARKKNEMTYDTWVRVDATLIQQGEREYMVFANFVNYTGNRELESIYQSAKVYREMMNQTAMATFHFNLTMNICDDGTTKEYPYMLKLQESGTVDGFFADVAKNNIDSETTAQYVKIFNRKSLLDSFEKGTTHLQIDHRYRIAEDRVEWITTNVDMMLNPSTNDIEGYIYAININREKIAELLISNIVDKEYDYVIFLDITTDRYITYWGTHLKSHNTQEEKEGFVKMLHSSFTKSVIPSERSLLPSSFGLDTLKAELEQNGSYQINYHIKSGSKENSALLRFAYLDREAGYVIVTRRVLD